ncbi:MAG: hypothetical protein R3F29_07730 [Planctomycetota bacterium]
MRRLRVLALPLVAASLFVRCTSAPCPAPDPQEREHLRQELGRDPEEALRAIGAAPDRAAAGALAATLRESLTPRQALRLLRFGLGNADERVVFGAVLMDGHDRFAAPELANAARIALPRLGDPDCPLAAGDTSPMIGSGDFEAAALAVPKMEELDASWFLGALHRMVRPDAVPPLCRLALASEGAVRRGAFSDAELCVQYSREHEQLLVATWLQLVGRESEPDGDGLPGLLAAALRVALELPEEPAPAEGELDRRQSSFPAIVCARWLWSSRAAAKDLPLLQSWVRSAHWPLRNVAAWSIGGVPGDEAARILRGPDCDELSPAVVLGARARHGDQDALAQLLDSVDEGLAFGLALASPAQRSEWAARFTQLPLERALEVVAALSTWASPDWFGEFPTPPYDDRFVAALVPAVTTAPDVDVRLLRALTDALPCFETGAVADALLAHPADVLFVDAEDDQGMTSQHGVGHRGVWAFLEVTRPAALRERLREGLRGESPELRDLCAHMLLRIGDQESLESLVAWIDACDDDPAEAWLQLAALGTSDVQAVLRLRLTAEARAPERAELARALAVALGAPREVAELLPDDDEPRLAVLCDALLAGDVDAFLLGMTAAPIPLEVLAALGAWSDPAVRTAARARIEADAEDAQQLLALDRRWSFEAGDRAATRCYLQPLRDGRYATHAYSIITLAARVDDLSMLSFWIDQLATNCCKVAELEEVFLRWFGSPNPGAFDHAKRLEPAAVGLRRRLLPVVERLRWSRIAGAYVVAGE